MHFFRLVLVFLGFLYLKRLYTFLAFHTLKIQPLYRAKLGSYVLIIRKSDLLVINYCNLNK